MANTSTPYFNSPKFDITEWAQLITLWTSFMIDGLTATLFQACDWLEGQMMIQLGDLHPANRTYSNIEPQPTIEPQAMIEPQPTETILIPMDEPATIEPITTAIIPDGSTMTYKDLQAMLKEYRDSRGEIQCKLNAKKSKLLEECRRLGLTA